MATIVQDLSGSNASLSQADKDIKNFLSGSATNPGILSMLSSLSALAQSFPDNSTLNQTVIPDLQAVVNTLATVAGESTTAQALKDLTTPINPTTPTTLAANQKLIKQFFNQSMQSVYSTFQTLQNAYNANPNDPNLPSYLAAFQQTLGQSTPSGQGPGWGVNDFLWWALNMNNNSPYTPPNTTSELATALGLNSNQLMWLYNPSYGSGILKTIQDDGFNNPYGNLSAIASAISSAQTIVPVSTTPPASAELTSEYFENLRKGGPT